MINKKLTIKIILTILLLGISMMIVFFAFYFFKKDNNLEGVIFDKKISINEQYLELIDLKNNQIKVKINDNTIFRSMLKLEKNDKIYIKGEFLDDGSFLAEEISDKALQKN